MDDSKLHIDLYLAEGQKPAASKRVVPLKPFISRPELVRIVCGHFLDHPEDRSLICTPAGWDLVHELSEVKKRVPIVKRNNQPHR